MKIAAKGVSFVLLVALAAVWLVPVALVVMNAFKTQLDFSQGHLWKWPASFALFANIRDAWVIGELGKGFISSLSYGVLGSAISILLAALAAYGLVILKIRGGFYWFLLIYSGTIFPFQMYLVPLYKAYVDTGLYNTFFGLLLFYTAISIPFCVFLLRNYMMTLPFEVVEAARMEGCSNFKIFSSMTLPMLVSPISVLFIFQFTWIWNDLVFGMTLSQAASVRPIMAGLASMQGVFFRTGVTTLLAAVLITSIPTIVVFFALQRNFIKGMQLTVKS